MFVDYHELADRYQSLKLYQRLVVVSLIACIPAAYYMFDKSTVLDVEYNDAKSLLEASNVRFNDHKKKSSALDGEEQQVNRYEVDLVQARKMLPDFFMMDDVLHSTATEAMNNGLDLKLFDPMEMDKVRKSQEQKWQALPIQLRTSGTYAQVAKFLDSILHFDKLVHFESITLTGLASANPNEAQSSRQVLNRNSVRPTVEAQAEMLVYASLP